ncbi:VID27 cytoplasmic protein [Hysterangium stoloniferum]|nr:VID27 cytoplasmic protein [Hysterangium stoloniferum]
MNVLKSHDPNATELAQISSGQLYLVRSDDVKGSRECIFQDAMATIRRVVSTEYHYQLVVTRVFEEGEELLLDEDDETDQERSFLIDEALHFRLGTFDSHSTYLWRDLEEDDEDLYEFVATGADSVAVAAFEMAIYRAMYERKYSKSAMDIPDARLKQFALNAPPSQGKSKAKSDDVAGIASAIGNLTVSATPVGGSPLQPPSNRPAVISEPAFLYLWDETIEKFKPEGVVQASIIENGPRDYWLRAQGPEAFASHQIVPELNPRFATHVQSITWNQYSPRGREQSYCIRFEDMEAFEHFKETYIQCQYEMLHDVAWARVKACCLPDEQLYALRSYDEDVEMADGTGEEDEEDEVESELDIEKEEEEEEPPYEQDEDNPQAQAFKHGGVNKQLVVSKDRSYVENEGRIGVFKNSQDMGELQYIATINKLVGPKGKGKAFIPKKMMLHNQDTAMILQNPDAPNSLFHLDIEIGKVVEEWKVHDDVTVDHIAPSTKFSQAQPERTVVGASHNALFRVDPRLSGNKMVDSQFKQYVSKNAFSSLATTANGKLAVASEKGDIRLFDVIGKNAKTALPPLGDPILGVDVTANGRYIVATTKTYLLLIDTLIGEGRYKGQLGFDRSFPANAKPMPKRLQLKPEHVMYMDGLVSFTPARFNSTEESQDENLIVTSNGNFVVAWDFTKVKRGRLDEYKIKYYPTRVVQDNFKFGDDKDIIVATEDNVLSTNKTSLKAATRKSLGVTPTKSRSSIVNSPF